MVALASTIGIGLLTNTIYDIVKYTGIKFVERGKNKEKEIRDIIETTISKRIPDNLKYLFDSSTYISYFSSPQFLDVINAYIEHKIICNNTTKSDKIQNYIEKGGIISIEDVINYISDNIYDLYIKNGVVTVPSKNDIKSATACILNISEEVVAQSLSPETSHLIYFFNSRADINHKQIISVLTKLKNMVYQIQDKQLSPVVTDYEEIREKYHDILKEKNSDAHIYLLDKFPFEKFYVPPILKNASIDDNSVKMYDYITYAGSYTSWNNIFIRNNIVYLTGGAGYGKSLFTKKIINNYKELNFFHSDEYIVIYGELKSFYPNGSDSSISVVDFLKESIKNSTLMDVPKEFVEHYLNAGRCIILLDALDEVEKSKRVSLHESVVAFFKNQNPNNKICITSRDRGFIPEKNVEVFKICPLNEEQIEKYVDKIIALGKFEKTDKESFMKQSEILVEKGFLNSFLVLSLLINIYKAERELPENKLELYQKCFDYIANKREKDKTQKDFDWKAIVPIMKDNTFIELSRMGLPNNSNIDKNDIKNQLLQIYKTKYVSEAEAENAIDEFLKFCSDRTELFVPTVEDKYKFFHRSFFEYFYSLYIFLRCENETERLEELLKFDVDSEVFELTVAMLKQQSEKEYQALVELMFDKAVNELNSDVNDLPIFNMLILSMQVIDDALYRKRFLDIIISQKENLKNKIKYIHNLKLISSLYDNDADSCYSICDAYQNECFMFVYASYDRIFTIAEEFSEKNDEDFFELVFNDSLPRKELRYFVFNNLDVDEEFYVPIFFKMRDCKEILMNATKEKLLEIYNQFSHRNYRKKTQHTLIAIEKFRDFSEERQEHIIKSMLSSPYMFI